ncbi:fungal-specific transcription factor domain-containing protein [Colletotrichum godetiae]|uniref:Fungal-specific transcription factor domain-containing protein n=1 Tax=Colletotrichum godetiae TaxID=1209918 RepID=A0AAJ0EPA4_9PEZI|nr:fungal-specific transcription factor domain-containing protein [Colletotrichum godetiae]KAK1671466.1 fungal-specific transcription factor domain-containing protein [Colletotrichum godetiae]
MDANSMAILFAEMARNSEVILQTPAGSTSTKGESLLDKILDGDEDLNSLKEASPAPWGRSNDGDEYTGPSSGISTVSDLGLNWIREKVPDSDRLCETIQDIRNGILSHIRQPKCITQDLPLALLTPHRIFDLAQPQLLEYVDAYFTQVQVVFPILDRDSFHSQLAEMGDGTGSVQKPSWMALLNVVVASGLRALLSDETSEAFRTSGSEAWGYFRSALSYESQIVHGATELWSVQAVALMAVFAQGLSSPQRLEYTLSSVASQLAQSIRLNCTPPPEWNLSEVEKKERNRVFWAVYCLDKSIALRCGRPAVLCDEEISCRFPQGINLVHSSSGDTDTEIGEKTLEVDFFRYFAKLARIGGDISRSLYSASALFMSISRLVPTLDRLLQDLEGWLESIPAKVRPGRPLSKVLGRQGLSRVQTIVLHSSYYYALCSIFRGGSPMFNQGNRNIVHLIDRRSHISHI